MAITYSAFPRILNAFCEAPGPMLTKSSKLLDVGIESLLAGCVRVLFSATRAVAVYWIAMNPLDRPGFEPLPTKNGGRPLFNEGSSSAATRLSETLDSVDRPKPRMSIAIETGCP